MRKVKLGRRRKGEKKKESKAKLDIGSMLAALKLKDYTSTPTQEYYNEAELANTSYSMTVNHLPVPEPAAECKPS